MTLKQFRQEIRELKNQIIRTHEPAAKVFIFGANDNPSHEEIENFRVSHPRTHVVILFRRSCRKESQV